MTQLVSYPFLQAPLKILISAIAEAFLRLQQQLDRSRGENPYEPVLRVSMVVSVNVASLLEGINTKHTCSRPCTTCLSGT